MKNPIINIEGIRTLVREKNNESKKQSKTDETLIRILESVDTVVVVGATNSFVDVVCYWRRLDCGANSRWSFLRFINSKKSNTQNNSKKIQKVNEKIWERPGN